MDEPMFWREGFSSFGNRYFKNSFKQIVEVPDMVYNKNMLCIGKTIQGRPYHLDLREACRIIIIGATRSGKTFSMRSLMDRLYTTDCDIIHLNDCKDEFKSSRYPVQPKFRHLLFPNESPRGLKLVALRPTFFKQVDDTLPENNYWFSVDFSNMTQNDFLTFMNVSELTATQKILLELLYEQMHTRLKNGEKFSVELMEEMIEQIEGLTAQQINSMKMKFRPLRTAKFYEEENEIDVVELIKRGFIPSINMENFDAFGKGSFLYPEVVLSIVLRNVIMARRSKKIRPTWIFMDEAPRFIGNDKKTSIKSQVQESFMLDTRYDINYVVASQVYDILPEDMRYNTKYVFVPRSVDVNNMRQILMDCGMFKNVQSSVNEAIRIKKQMTRIPFSWLVINKMDMSKNIITFSAPLSQHLETGD